MNAKRMVIRCGLALGVLGGIGGDGSTRAGQPRTPVEARRVIFNCDGHSVRIDGNEAYSVEKWIDNLFTGLDARHVDALFWCDGSGGNTALYDSQVLEFSGKRIGKPDPWVSKWIAEGNDPPVVVIREARKRGIDVFYSFRINDIHDSFTPPELPTFKVEHPEWQIGKDQPYGYPTALNFAIPAVRELKRRTIEELFAKYDFDGIEIDFMRSPPFFLPGTEPDNTHILTDFLRTVRKLLDARAKQRGKRIEVAARVDETLEGCRLDGFDVATWVTEGLVDILIAGSGVIEVDTPAFRKLLAGSPVRFYPCLYGWPSQYNPIPAELARGIAATFWRDQPDGIYLFNWFPHQQKHRYQVDLLRRIGNPKSLAGLDVMYAAERGKKYRDYPHNWLRAKLPTTLGAGKWQEIPIEIGRRPSAGAKAELRVTVTGTSPLMLRFDGHVIEGIQTPTQGKIVVRLPVKWLMPGRHKIGLHLTEGEAKVTAVEIHVQEAKNNPGKIAP